MVSEDLSFDFVNFLSFAEKIATKTLRLEESRRENTYFIFVNPLCFGAFVAVAKTNRLQDFPDKYSQVRAKCKTKDTNCNSTDNYIFIF